MSYPNDYLILLQDLESAYARFAQLEKDAAATMQSIGAHRQLVADLLLLLSDVKQASPQIEGFRAFAQECAPFLATLRNSHAAIVQARAAQPEIAQCLQLVQQLQSLQQSDTLQNLRDLTTNGSILLADFRAATPAIDETVAKVPELEKAVSLGNQFKDMVGIGMLSQLSAFLRDYGPTLQSLVQNKSALESLLATAKVKATPRPPIQIRAGTKPGEEATFQIYPGVFVEFCWIPVPSEIEGNWYENDPKNRVPQNDQHKLGNEWKRKIKAPFWLSKHLCTQHLWETVMGQNPSEKKGPNRPVTNINWTDIQQMMEKCMPLGDWTIDLPSLDQWIYSARAGSGDENLRVGVRFTMSGRIYAGGAVPLNDSQGDVGTYEGTTNLWGVSDIISDCGIVVESNCYAQGLKLIEATLGMGTWIGSGIPNAGFRMVVSRP